MAALSFFAYFFLGVGPGLVFYAFFIATKSFLVLLSLFSAFYWLVVLLLTSAIFKGFEPVDTTVASYAGVLVGAVTIQELFRYPLWLMDRKCVEALDAVGRSAGQRLSLMDKLHLALGWGWGHGACQVTFLFVYILSLAAGDGTWYLDTCPQMSILLSGALSALAVGMLLPSLMVVALEGYHTRNWRHIAFAPAMHYTFALLTLVNFQVNGCVVAVPCLLALGVANIAYAIHIAWSKGVTSTSTIPLNPQSSSS